MTGIDPEFDNETDAPCRNPQDDGRGFCRNCDHIMHVPGELPVQAMPRTPGRIAYEADVERRPTYHDGKPRRTWGELEPIMQQSWERSALLNAYAKTGAE